MSRNRSSSSASTGTPSKHPLIIKLYQLSRPSLSITHDHDHPELPPLPQTQLTLPKSAQPVYVGEEFQCILSVQLQTFLPDDVAGGEGLAQQRELLSKLEEELKTDGVHLRADVEAPDGSRIELISKQITVSKEHPWAAEKAAFEVTSQGTWLLRTSIRYYHGAEEKTIRRVFKLEASPAISVRTKVSKGSSALKAHVLEAQIENLSESTLVIESCTLTPENGWDATAPSSIITEEESAGGGIILRPRDVNQWSFVLRGGWAPEAGPLSIGWRREPLGANGWQTTGSIRI